MIRAICLTTFYLSAALLPLLLAGCGGGPVNYQVSGTVTYDGKPVPVGEVVFEPDTSKGNNGPGSVADIKDGKYTTTSGKGVVGGAYIIRVTGFDGVMTNPEASYGAVLFPQYEERVDLPEGTTEKNIVVPKK